MADNIQVSQGTGTTMATDDVGGVQYPRVKLSVGADGSATDVSSANPIPSNDVDANTKLASIDGKLPTLSGGRVPVDIGGSGSITVTSGTITVANTVEITNDVGSPIPVSGTVTANTGLSQPLTDAQLRAVAVPVSGTVTANTGLSQPLTDAQLRATTVPVSVSGVSTEAKQDTGNTSLSSIDGKITACNTGAVTISAALPAGTNVIGKTGYRLVKVSANFTRPSGTTAYTSGDAVTNSTSAPTVFQLDLGALGAVNGQGIEVRKLAVVSSVKQALLPLFNVFLSATTFTATNDHVALDIADATMQADGAWFNCDVQNYTASNSRVEYLSTPQAMILDASDTNLYGTIQAANAYTPVSGEVFYILAWVALL